MEASGPKVHTGRSSPPPGPFGYSFLSPMDTPFEQAPALPPGPSLLDDNESNMLDNFFTTMNANNFTNDLWLRGQQNKTSNLNFDWSDELPPTFQGSTTSLSQPSLQEQQNFGKSGLLAGGAPGADIYAAASMLYQGGMGPDMTSTLSQQAFSGQHLPVNGVHARRASLPAAPAQQPVSSPRNQIPSGFHTSQMLFDVHDPIPADQHPSRKVRSLHWGSDISFMDQGYVRPADQPDEETRTRDLLDHLGCFEPQSSAANTRAPSPNRMTGPHGQRASFASVDTDYSSQSRKRQRTTNDSDPFSDEDDTGSRKSRVPGNAKIRRASTDTSRKAKVTPASKAARENLTEEQKRTNHILSEQKRRNLIRQGFDDLCTLVPGLRGGGFSKSAMLTQAADWLEDITRGNEILKSQLADMKGINGLVMPR
ncbi:transcriptional regulator family: Helix-loop-helix [Penicillium capsulatum]|uniref:Transcriptional regulator family: Helix-loop-helix n=1 Tax=Penicillium capsulatum TaxID=69766 RepID=A0A9W9LR02_9EURO|nr:transcriptional regulator family: Helix-loop-helix [Penicillium capsulatum]KAJ6135469.1 transcriptional regulator family: Helix-loop-helix [Penicillium capsulatum]